MEVRERILKAAEELFLKFGIRSVTMDEIASELGISKKTIYMHFADKDSIVEEVAVVRMTCEQEMSEVIHKESENPIHEVVREIEMLKANIANFNPVIIYDLKKYYPKVWALFQEHKKTIYLDIIKENLKEGIKQGLYRPEVNVEILARLRMEEIDFAFEQSVFPKDKFNQYDIHKTFIDHFLRGIITLKGLEVYEKYISTTQL
ncbi:transcriptional regulator, TetR family [Emticicia oligotrophica DSM 17448]|uniref:Transcriptional regulator, TetR family n=1 Tax=Emticicia oligotrophica (strain DSM 17448 / CIP 109782 / MTCC 6937 / GPTSA100-15) TaxID=929562 RepID=A0ABN4AJU0_EMTOG|nr:TetR/AcrR family transcriptional regulator [Emticicia oligotrophica]AFK02457.1 transcriptional regulator, TetR family [Emticicia oligotrophica DSM 17448]